jgi:hypothetical protein
MFPVNDLDERGEVPAPFCIEKHNFNPHNLLGDFDKKARRVNNHGWFTIPNQGHIVDKDGRKKFDKRQL